MFQLSNSTNIYKYTYIHSIHAEIVQSVPCPCRDMVLHIVPWSSTSIGTRASGYSYTKIIDGYLPKRVHRFQASYRSPLLGSYSILPRVVAGCASSSTAHHGEHVLPIAPCTYNWGWNGLLIILCRI
jgi:hypothetical protein